MIKLTFRLSFIVSSPGQSFFCFTSDSLLLLGFRTKKKRLVVHIPSSLGGESRALRLGFGRGFLCNWPQQYRLLTLCGNSVDKSPSIKDRRQMQHLHSLQYINIL